MKEYWDKMERLRRRINRKIHEIHLLRQRAEGMNGSGITDMPRTVSPDRSKMENTVFKIMALEQDIKDTQAEYDALIADIEARINAVQDSDARALLSKRYLEFKSWSTPLLPKCLSASGRRIISTGKRLKVCSQMQSNSLENTGNVCYNV